MSKPILEIQHIGKKYRIQQSQQPYISLRDSIGQWFKPKSQSQDFWALNDVSFTVNAGDTIGIIGKNGAGKSTLLKILSRITPPTTGKVIARGRIASLLEVGTGFHPELSGRENVFMNGSILGMRRAEIKTHFDAIVDFAGVAQFIDTPLKHYSSGMQLRLAFAVAAFLQNEILIIDEVLAVGDAEFQKKCLGKMDEVSKSGRTVLFVSHNMGSITNLCNKGVLLINGNFKLKDNIEKIVNAYSALSNNVNKNTFTPYKRSGIGNLIVKELKLNKAKLLAGEKMIVEFELSSNVKIESIFLDFRIDNYLGEKCLWISNKLTPKTMQSKEATFISFEIPKLNLNVGIYKITYCLFKNNIVEDTSEDCISFEVLINNFYENWHLPPREQTNILTDFITLYK